jgi:hypothetical protein
MIGRSPGVLLDRKKWQVRIFLSLVLVLTAAAQLFPDDISFYQNSRVYLHPMIKSGAKKIRSLAVVSSVVASAEFGVRGIRNKELESEVLVSDDTYIVSEALKKRGWRVDDSSLSI